MQQDGIDLALGHFIQLRAKRGQGFVEQAAPQGNGFRVFLILEIVSYVAARFTGFDKTEPGRIWLGARSGNNFNCLAALQWFAQRGEAAADATGHTGITDICVDGIGKVYGSGARR